LENITALKGVAGTGTAVPTDGTNGTTWILDRATDDGSGSLRVNSGLDFESGMDLTRDAIYIDSSARLGCGAQTDLSIQGVIVSISGRLGP
jgi:hypothetical protein